MKLALFNYYTSTRDSLAIFYFSVLFRVWGFPLKAAGLDSTNFTILRCQRTPFRTRSRPVFAGHLICSTHTYANVIWLNNHFLPFRKLNLFFTPEKKEKKKIKLISFSLPSRERFVPVVLILFVFDDLIYKTGKYFMAKKNLKIIYQMQRRNQNKTLENVEWRNGMKNT